MSLQESVEKAIEYCEERGLIPHKISNNTLVYYANYPKYIAEPRRTYKVVVKLSTMQETRELLKRWNQLGNENMYR